MKKTAITIVVLVIATFSFAQKLQEKNVPANVKSAFQKSYPTAKSIKWDKEADKYEASFDLNKSDHSVLLDANGSIIETEVEIELNQLPKGVLTYVKSKYAGNKAKDAAKITDAKGSVTFEVAIKGLDLIFFAVCL